jgi:hypothetical protein
MSAGEDAVVATRCSFWNLDSRAWFSLTWARFSFLFWLGTTTGPSGAVSFFYITVSRLCTYRLVLVSFLPSFLGLPRVWARMSFPVGGKVHSISGSGGAVGPHNLVSIHPTRLITYPGSVYHGQHAWSFSYCLLTWFICGCRGWISIGASKSTEPQSGHVAAMHSTLQS